MICVPCCGSLIGVLLLSFDANILLWFVLCMIRFGLHIFYSWFQFMDPINIRLYYGGQFNKTTYERCPNVALRYFGVALRLNVEEVCYFEFVYWIKTDLGYNDVGEIWYRKHGCSLHTGRAKVTSDKDIPDFLAAPEKDGFYHLYLVQPENVSGDSKRSESNTLNNSSCGPHENLNTHNLSFEISPQKTSEHISQPNQAVQQHSQKKPHTPKSLLEPRFREKLPIISTKKKPACVSKHIPQTEEEEQPDLVEGTDVDEGSEEDTDVDDSDVLLSDDDYEDQNDDDLFNEFVDEGIEESVTHSLRHLRGEEGRLSDNDDVVVEGDGFAVPDEVELNDSDDEKLSIIGSDDEGPHYPVFNQDTDLKGTIVFIKGLKFADNNLFRKALQWQAIQRGYNYFFLHNNNSRVSVYCAQRCGCPVQKGRILKCTCKVKNKCRIKIHCKKLKKEESWQIKSIRPDHICEHQTNNPKLTSQYLAERYLVRLER